MEFPNHHRHIVEDLMAGKFLLPQERTYQVLKENEQSYNYFFKASFNYELRVTQDYAYLVSEESAEMLSRDICIFIALLSYELDRDGMLTTGLDEFREALLVPAVHAGACCRCR